MPARQVIEISFGTLVKGMLLVLGIIFLYLIRDVVAIILLSVVIASAMEPAVRALGKWRLPRVLSALLLYIIAFGLFTFVFYLLIPPFLHELRNFISGFPVYLEQVLLEGGKWFRFLPIEITDVSLSITDLTERLDTFVGEHAASFFSVGTSLLGGALSVVFIVVISFYLVVQENGIANFLKIITPIHYESYVIDLWGRAQQKIGRWLQGQIILGMLVGVLVYLGLTLLGVQYALVLALLSALFELIPYFGPIMAAIPAVAIAAMQAPILGLWVLGLYFVVQQLENHLIYPLVVRKTVGLPPILVIVALLTGGRLGGFFGFVLAVPIMASLVEYLNDVAKQKKVFEKR